MPSRSFISLGCPHDEMLQEGLSAYMLEAHDLLAQRRGAVAAEDGVQHRKAAPLQLAGNRGRDRLLQAIQRQPALRTRSRVSEALIHTSRESYSQHVMALPASNILRR